MATTITKGSALLALARMMGKRKLPQGDNADWESYVQAAFDYAWRYYKWGWSLRSAVIDMATSPYLPDDFDLDGYREAVPNGNGQVSEMTLVEWYTSGMYSNTYAIEWDDTVKKYKIHAGSGLSSLTVIYQVAPPTLGDTAVNFPSDMTIGIGASIYAKQGENPLKADVQQEWDEFHAELRRHVAHSENNKPRRQSVNLQDYYGTYTGDTRR